VVTNARSLISTVNALARLLKRLPDSMALLHARPGIGNAIVA
jgi:hypothetical protein